MSKPPDPLRELARLARVAEPGGRSIGLHIEQHAAALAKVLDVPEFDLLAAAGHPDETLAPKVQAALGRLHASRRAALATRGAASALDAARRLRERSRWQDGAVLLDHGVVLGELLDDGQRPHIVFALHDGTEVPIRRDDLVATARTVGRRPDLSAFVDGAGLHVRWAGGRGGLNWYPRRLTHAEREVALRVELPGPARAPAPAPRRRTRSWSWDAMADLGFAT